MYQVDLITGDPPHAEIIGRYKKRENALAKGEEIAREISHKDKTTNIRVYNNIGDCIWEYEDVRRQRRHEEEVHQLFRTLERRQEQREIIPVAEMKGLDIFDKMILIDENNRLAALSDAPATPAEPEQPHEEAPESISIQEVVQIQADRIQTLTSENTALSKRIAELERQLTANDDAWRANVSRRMAEIVKLKARIEELEPPPKEHENDEQP